MAEKPSNCPVDSLTVAEQGKLQQAWVHLFRLCGLHDLDGSGALSSTPDRTKQFLQIYKDKSTEGFRTTLWRFILSEHPDALLLRFLRARKWDVELAVTMLVSAMDWRNDNSIDQTIIRGGENVGLIESPTTDEKAFIAQYQSGKSYVRGTDKEGRPIYIIKVRLHDPNAQSSQAMETYILHNIESIRILSTYPLDKACLIFDMTGFGLRNMDFHVVKFLCTVFEARYPETLGLVLIHNAPFVFSGVWRVIKPWLDPVIAAKINFTRSSSDLLCFISKENLQEAYGGTDSWEYEYLGPVAGENERLGMDEKRGKLLDERDELAKEFERETVQWLSMKPDTPEARAVVTRREELNAQLRLSYWKLDPFIRARTYYHRVGVMKDNGQADFKAAGLGGIKVGGP